MVQGQLGWQGLGQKNVEVRARQKTISQVMSILPVHKVTPQSLSDPLPALDPALPEIPLKVKCLHPLPVKLHPQLRPRQRIAQISPRLVSEIRSGQKRQDIEVGASLGAQERW